MSDVFGRPRVIPSAMPVARMQRRTRRPVHNAYVHFVPWVLQPFFIAPVLPGETLKNLMMQARVLTTPLANNQTVGWWFETYFFFLKHRHLENAAGYTQMMLDMSATAGTTGAVEPEFNALATDAPFARECYWRIVQEFFRGSTEDEGDGVHGSNLNYVRLRLPGWWDSIVPTDALSDQAGIGADTIGGADLDSVGELGAAIEQWQTLRMLNLTALEYDDWLRSFGVSIAAPKDDRPELVRYSREWQYPASAVSVDATSQRVSSVLSWSITERADKNRFFKEPGFLCGYVVARPKLYHARQQAGIGHLNNAMGWQTPFRSGLWDGHQPVQGMAGYSFDTTDLYNQGDQYRYIERGTSVPTLAWPADGILNYPNTTLINSLFADGANGHVKMDAVVSLNIASGAVAPDRTPTT